MLPQLPVSYFIITYNTASHSGVVQLLSCVQLFAIPWTAARQSLLSFTISQSLLKFVSIESMMPSNHLILCHPLLLLPSIFPSITVFSSELALRFRWPKYWSFSFSSSPSNEYSGLISFRIDWFDLLAVHGTLRVYSSITVQKHLVLSLLNGPALISIYIRTSLVAQMVKNLPAMRETWVQSLVQKDPLERGMATLSSILT